MGYFTGLHPHIRSSDSLTGRYWTAAALLFPAVIFKGIASSHHVFLLPVFFLAAAAGHFLFSFRQPERPKNIGWNRGIYPLFIFLWFLILPLNLSFPAPITGFIFLVLMYEASGGLGAYAVHPVLAGFLAVHLFSPHEFMNKISSFGVFFVWDWAGLLCLAFGGIYLGLQKKIRLLPAFVFMISSVFPALFLGLINFDFFYAVILLGFYVLTDSVVSPLKASAHLLQALGAGLTMTVFMLLGSGVLLSGVLSLAIWNLTAQGFDFLALPRMARGRAHD